MSNTDDLLYTLGQISEYGKEYVRSKTESTRLEIAERSTGIIAEVVNLVLVVIISVFFIFFSSIALSFLLSDYFGSYFLGFGAVSLIYLSLIIVTLILKKTLFSNLILRKILKYLF